MYGYSLLFIELLFHYMFITCLLHNFYNSNNCVANLLHSYSISLILHKKDGNLTYIFTPKNKISWHEFCIKYLMNDK